MVDLWLLPLNWFSDVWCLVEIVVADVSFSIAGGIFKQRSTWAIRAKRNVESDNLHTAPDIRKPVQHLKSEFWILRFYEL